MNGLSEALDQVPVPAAYAVLALVVLAESVLLLGPFVPTLTLLLTAGALARTGHLDLFPVIATAASAAVVGDFLAHRAGGLIGARLLTGRLGCSRLGPMWRRAEALLARYGGRAVFISRFTPVVRTVTPYAAGAARLPYRRIAPCSAFAALLWASIEAGAGYAATASMQYVLAVGPALAVGLAVAGGLTTWARRSRRAVSRPR